MKTANQNSPRTRIVKLAGSACLSGLVFAGCLAGANAQAMASSLAGTWAGSGIVKPILGSSTQTRCRVSYTKSSSNVFRMSASCGNSSGKASQVATLKWTSGNSYKGRFRNAKLGMNGVVYVTLNGNHQVIRLKAAVGSATIKLTRR